VASIQNLVETKSPALLDWGLLVALVLLWGSAYAMTHIGVEVLPPAVLVCARLTIGAVVLGIAALIFKVQIPPLKDTKTWAALAVIGVMGTLGPFLLISIAQKSVPSALAAIYIAAAPLVVALLCHVFVEGDRLTWSRAIGIGVGFAGVCLLFAPALMDHSLNAAPLGAQGLLLIAAFLYGATSVTVKLANPNTHPIAMSFGFVAFAAMASLPLAAAAWPPTGLVLEGRHIWAVLGLGVASTGIANLLYVMSIRRVGPVFMSNVGNLAPFWSIILGSLAFAEALPPTTFAALAIILAGVWLVQRRVSQKNQAT
jgi:drug/metabolite transporter (DMT)-like permease